MLTSDCQTQCICERERLIGVHKRRSVFSRFVIDQCALLEMNADLNAICKSTVIGPINHKSQKWQFLPHFCPKHPAI